MNTYKHNTSGQIIHVSSTLVDGAWELVPESKKQAPKADGQKAEPKPKSKAKPKEPKEA